MKKRIYALIGLIVAFVMVLTACSAGKDNEAANGTTEVKETVSAVSKESTSELTTVESTTEATTEVTTTKKPVTTTKKAVTTTKKAVTTTKKKVTTTKKATTTKKNVTPQEVQKQVNAYIKSKGIKIDTSMTSKNASWRTQISRTQDKLNSGRTLNHCKEWVDYHLDEYNYKIDAMYCYYDSNSFYILYYPSIG